MRKRRTTEHRRANERRNENYLSKTVYNSVFITSVPIALCSANAFSDAAAACSLFCCASVSFILLLFIWFVATVTAAAAAASTFSATALACQ